MKIFLVYLVIDSSQNFEYNYGLGYIAAVLKNKGNDVSYHCLLDKESIIELYRKIEQEKPEIVAFSSTTSQFNYLIDIAKNIKAIARSLLICGGIHATMNPNCIYEISELDAIVRGEGEYPMLELVDALTNNNRDNYNIRNFWFRDGIKIIKNEIRPLTKNLDELPFPYKDSLRYQEAIDRKGGLDRFIFNRGCAFACTYCSNKALNELYGGGYYRVRNPEKCIQEITLESERFQFESIVFDDDIINLDKKWFYEFFDLYKKTFKYKFFCNIRPDTINLDMVKLLRSAGCIGVNIGVEHGNELFRHKYLGRSMTNRQIKDVFMMFEENGITENWAQLMVGLPFENKKLFMDTVKLSRQLHIQNNIDAQNSISIFTPYPGTELYRVCENSNWLSPDGPLYREREKAVISYPGFHKRDIQLCHDSFDLLIRHKFIPLFIPLEIIAGLRKNKMIKKIFYYCKAVFLHLGKLRFPREIPDKRNDDGKV